MSTMPSPGRVGDVRRRNVALVLAGIQKNDGTTRAQLAAESGLTKASVSSIVTDLLEAGLVRETSVTRDGERGRPGTGLVLNPARGALAAEINVDYLAVGVLDFKGDLTFHETLERHNRGSLPSDILPLLVAMAQRAVTKAAAAGVELLGGELTVPGLVDVERNVVLAAPNLGWADVELSEELPKLLPVAPFGVSLSNEANSAALAELWFGHGADNRTSERFRDFLYISGEVGVGGGLVIDSQLFAGPQGHAGEIGHVVVHPDGPVCACGGHGCLEAFAGQNAIYSAAGIEWDSTSRQMALLLQLAHDGDERAVSAVEQAGRYLGVAVASTARFANISAVVLGGHFVVLEELITPALRRSLDRHAPGLIPEGNVAVSGLGQTAALRGAAEASVRRILNQAYELIP
ncbi:ROK family transcriptional regulator [Arthrobacter bambusae]|uniref:ROK family transcriptional regulator n=1 Tax=Arthrobacter bambusae TaxID=1338426 RepID=UPI00278095BC|nr:ROK family transcriptional regulator [Arthrobacter bambusae]MDQ0028743.1 putative NBD/HSP70 family sugar kinase [Arthrobacter bambusae]MDQ0096464.1 putative NBD/HSP70 family sugar kinase [Arthrobacter bambusae]